MPSFLSHMASLEAGGPTPFARAAAHLLGRSNLPGMIVVISDLLTPEWRALIQLSGSGSDITVLHILCEEDLEPTHSGDLELVDRESRERLTVSVTEDVSSSYRERVARWREEVASAALGSGATYLAVDAEDDVEALLLKSWREAGVLR